MGKVTYSLVCRCTPEAGIVHISAQLLRPLLLKELHRIANNPNARKQALRALRLGDLCANCGFPYTALKIYHFGRQEVYEKDAEWASTPINPQFCLPFCEVISPYEYHELSLRVDSLWRRIGHPEMAHYASQTRSDYYCLFMERYYDSLP